MTEIPTQAPGAWPQGAGDTRGCRGEGPRPPGDQRLRKKPLRTPGPGGVLQSAQGGDRARCANTAPCSSRHANSRELRAGPALAAVTSSPGGPEPPPSAHTALGHWAARHTPGASERLHGVREHNTVRAGGRPRHPDTPCPRRPGPARPCWTAQGRPQPARVASDGQGHQSMRSRASQPSGGPLPPGTRGRDSAAAFRLAHAEAAVSQMLRS